ncbi:hypothetical protein U2086_14725, partial [Listeria monocytogenes]|uniref:hypothetical protein n=1 Tax=Listeria monocytogenes TaxID=1639 RepID=UPI002FDBFF20
VADPSNPDPVTVDGHIYWAWTGIRGRLHGPRNGRTTELPVTPSISPTLYAEISDAVRLVAELRGCLANQAQAVIWQAYRRKHDVMQTRQS